MSVALYCTLRRWGGVNQKLSARSKGRGALHAANPTHCNIPPMRVLGSARIPIVFLPEDCVHNITVSRRPSLWIHPRRTILLREQEHPELWNR